MTSPPPANIPDVESIRAHVFSTPSKNSENDSASCAPPDKVSTPRHVRNQLERVDNALWRRYREANLIEINSNAAALGHSCPGVEDRCTFVPVWWVSEGVGGRSSGAALSAPILVILIAIGVPHASRRCSRLGSLKSLTRSPSR